MLYLHRKSMSSYNSITAITAQCETEISGSEKVQKFTKFPVHCLKLLDKLS